MKEKVMKFVYIFRMEESKSNETEKERWGKDALGDRKYGGYLL